MCQVTPTGFGECKRFREIYFIFFFLVNVSKTLQFTSNDLRIHKPLIEPIQQTKTHANIILFTLCRSYDLFTQFFFPSHCNDESADIYPILFFLNKHESTFPLCAKIEGSFAKKKKHFLLFASFIRNFYFRLWMLYIIPTHSEILSADFVFIFFLFFGNVYDPLCAYNFFLFKIRSIYSTFNTWMEVYELKTCRQKNGQKKLVRFFLRLYSFLDWVWFYAINSSLLFNWQYQFIYCLSYTHRRRQVQTKTHSVYCGMNILRKRRKYFLLCWRRFIMAIAIG